MIFLTVTLSRETGENCIFFSLIGKLVWLTQGRRALQRGFKRKQSSLKKKTKKKSTLQSITPGGFAVAVSPPEGGERGGKSMLC